MSITDINWVCTNCKSRDVVEDYSAGDLTCRDCGLVLAERIFQVGEDERHFESDDLDRTHVEHTNELTENVDLATGITNDGSAMAQTLRTTQRMAREDNSGQTRCFIEIERLCDRVGLPPACRGKAQELAKLFLETGQGGRGKKLKIIAASAVYIAGVHFQKEAMTFNELANEAQVDLKQVWKYYQTMLTQLRTVTDIPELTSTKDFLGRFFDALDIQPFSLKTIAEKAFVKARGLRGLNGKTPALVSAAILFLVCLDRKASNGRGEKITVDDIARVSNVSVSSIQNCYDNDIAKHKQFFLESD